MRTKGARSWHRERRSSSGGKHGPRYGHGMNAKIHSIKLIVARSEEARELLTYNIVPTKYVTSWWWPKRNIKFRGINSKAQWARSLPPSGQKETRQVFGSPKKHSFPHAYLAILLLPPTCAGGWYDMALVPPPLWPCFALLAQILYIECRRRRTL